MTPDHSRLLAVNSSDARLSVFDVSDALNPSPVLIAEIPVGLEPVAVRARTNDEVWVVNELSDSVSIVSLSAGAVVATLKVPDEPADVVFASGRAFVSCARNNLIRVIDPVARQEITQIPLQGMVPSALAVDPSGTKVFAAFLHSGNGTTILPKELAPPPPQPANPDLPPAPKTGLIVDHDHPQVTWVVLDRDVAEIDPEALTVARYFRGAGTNLLDLAVHPTTGDLWVANTEARNRVRFEPALRGHVVDHRLTQLSGPSGTATIFDLNPGIDYSILPNPGAKATALAQPHALAFSPDGMSLWVAAFGSDRVARIDPNTGAIVTRIDLRAEGETSRQMRGPRALAWKHSASRLYVLNKLANTISVIDTANDSLLAEVPVGSFDPMPQPVKEGRGFLFDARLSGNGTISCATCHLDADRDGIAWDLGDPGGQMITVMGANISAHDTTPRPRQIHPMKGPMTTQTLRGLSGGAPFHWRGDRPTLQSFNITFDALMGGSQLAQPDIDAMAEYLLTLRNHPNPNLLRNGNPPATVNGGDPLRGADLFTVHNNHCNECHSVPRGSNNNIDLHQEVGSFQPIKNPTLRTVYQRAFFSRTPGAESPAGFGLNSDGSGFGLPTAHPYILDELGTVSPNDFKDVTAFVLCFPTETRPSVGEAFTVTSATASSFSADLAEMELLARQQVHNLVARGLVGGMVRAYFYNRTTQRYEPDTAAEPTLTTAELLAALQPGDSLTFLGTPPGEGRRFGGDRDGNGILDRDEPTPRLLITPNTPGARLEWPAAPGGWFLEMATSLSSPIWSPVTGPITRTGGMLRRDEPNPPAPARFYRLRRSW